MEIVVDESEGYLEFIFKRFAVDLHRFLRSRLKSDVLVAFTTQTTYFDEERRVAVAEVPVDRRSNKTTVPSVSFSTANFSRQNTLFDNQFLHLPGKVVNSAGKLVDGYTRHPPIDLVDVGLTVRLFEADIGRLWRLQRLVHIYFDSNPYLFIPEDKKQLQGEQDPTVLAELIATWWAGETMSKPGFIVCQYLPDVGQLWRMDLKASVSNLVVAETTATLEALPVADEGDAGSVVVPFSSAEMGIHVESGETFFDGVDEYVEPLPIEPEEEA